MEVAGTLSAGASRGWFKFLSMFLWMWQLHESGPGQAEESSLISSCLLHSCDMGQKSPWATCSLWRLPEEATALPFGSGILTAVPKEISTPRPQHSRVPETHTPLRSGKSQPPPALLTKSLGTRPCSSPSLSSFVPSSQSGSGSERFHCTTATLALERCN